MKRKQIEYKKAIALRKTGKSIKKIAKKSHLEKISRVKRLLSDAKSEIKPLSETSLIRLL